MKQTIYCTNYVINLTAKINNNKMNKTINTASNQKPSVQTKNMKKLAKKINNDNSNNTDAIAK